MPSTVEESAVQARSLQDFMANFTVDGNVIGSQRFQPEVLTDTILCKKSSKVAPVKKKVNATQQKKHSTGNGFQLWMAEVMEKDKVPDDDFVSH